MKQKSKWKKKIAKFLSVMLGCVIFTTAIPIYASEQSTCKVTIVDELFDDDGNIVDSVVRQEDEVANGTIVRYMPTYYEGYTNYDSQKNKNTIYQEKITEDTTVYYRYVPGYCKIEARYLLFDVTELTEDEIDRIGNTYWEDGNDEELCQKLHSDTWEEVGEYRAGDIAEIKAPSFEGYKLVTINSDEAGVWSDVITRKCYSDYVKAVLPDEYKTEYRGEECAGGSNGGFSPTFLYVLDTDDSGSDAGIGEDIYTIDLSETGTTLSNDKFTELLRENVANDVVIKSSNNVTFSFEKGKMSVVEGVDSYDFGTSVIVNYTELSDVPEYVTENNFISKIHFNYSGKLPATASITFYAGTDKEGQTLYYYLCNADKSTTLIQSVVVDGNGYVTVKQEHCSDYILVSEELKEKDVKIEEVNKQETTTVETNTQETKVASEIKSPKTGDDTHVELYISMICICAIGLLLVGMKKRLQ